MTPERIAELRRMTVTYCTESSLADALAEALDALGAARKEAETARREIACEGNVWVRKSALDAERAKVARLVGIMRGLRYGTPPCWCDVSIGSPFFPSHSATCIAARAALRETEP